MLSRLMPAPLLQGFRVRVWGLGLGFVLCGLWFVDWGFGFGVWDFGCGVQGSGGFRVQGVGFVKRLASRPTSHLKLFLPSLSLSLSLSHTHTHVLEAVAAAEGLETGAWGFEFGPGGWGFRMGLSILVSIILGFGFEVSGVGFWVLGFGFWGLGSEF